MSDQELFEEAIRTIRGLTDRLALSESARRQDGSIAIIGMACQFPGAPHLPSFWDKLCAQYDAVSHYPEARLSLLGLTERDLGTPLSRIYGGYLEQIELFDAEQFGISPREARCMDPQQRLLLMNVHQAMLDAELSQRPGHKKTGVFVSHYASQYMHLARHYDADSSLFLITGNALSISANRISYHYNLSGPSLVIDTACSSSLVGVDIACRYLVDRRIDYAIVAGISLNISPILTKLLQDSSMLAPDGKCKTFDRSANGYVPGEGVGVVVLQRLTDCQPGNTKVYSVIRASQVNQDGKSNGLTAPNGIAQEQVIAGAFARAGIDPNKVQYVETHGTGTYLGDPVEIEALNNVVNKRRAPGEPCVLGCLKTNIGHLEPAAGIASLIKASLCISQGKIPANNHLREVNPLLNLDQTAFVLPRELLDWSTPTKIASISSFGFGGVNGHVVLTSPQRDGTDPRKDLLAQYPLHAFKLKPYWLKPAPAPPPEAAPAPAGSEEFLAYSVIDSPSESLRVLLPIEKLNLLGIGDTGNFHIGFYIETIHKLFVRHFGTPFITIESIEFLHLLYVSRQANTLIQIIVRAAEQGLYELEFHFRYDADKSKWLLAARASVSLAEESPPPLAVNLPESAPESRLLEEAFYARYTAMGYPGMGFVRVVASSDIYGRESFSALRLSFDKERYSLGVHPGFLDAVLQPGFVMNDGAANVLCMTTAMKKVRIFGPLRPGEQYGLYNRLGPDAGGSAKSFTMLWSIYDSQNRICIDCQETRLQSITMSSSALETLASFDPSRGLQLTPRRLLEEIASMLEANPDEISLDRQLLELGLDSLMIMKLQSMLDTLRLPLNNLFEVTVRQLQDALSVHASERADVPPPTNLRRDLHPPVMDRDRWVRGQRRGSAKIALYCFPYGHLSASMFRSWVKSFPAHIDVRPIELPGRGERLRERPIESAAALADCLERVLAEDLHQPFALLGHSAGTLVAFSFCLHLAQRGLPLPRLLFAGAFSAPCLPANPVVEALKNTYRSHGIDHIPTLGDIMDPRKNAFVHRVVDALLDSMNQVRLFSLSREFVEAQLHAIVATFRSVETFDRSLVRPLPVPIAALHGIHDAQVPKADMLAWEGLTTARYSFKEFDGDHSFINADQKESEIIEYVVRSLDDLLHAR